MKKEIKDFCIKVTEENRNDVISFFNEHFKEQVNNFNPEFLKGFRYGLDSKNNMITHFECINSIVPPVLTLAEARAMFEPEPEKKFPRMMLVRDLDKEKWVKREIDGIINGVAFSVTGDIFYWLQHKELTKTKVTHSDLLQSYAEKHGFSVDDIEVTE